jgi:hypothetical protein
MSKSAEFTKLIKEKTTLQFSVNKSISFKAIIVEISKLGLFVKLTEDQVCDNGFEVTPPFTLLKKDTELFISSANQYSFIKV